MMKNKTKDNSKETKIENQELKLLGNQAIFAMKK